MSEAQWLLPIVRAKAIAMMIDEIKGDLAALNIERDVSFSERSLIEGGNNRVAKPSISCGRRATSVEEAAAAEGRRLTVGRSRADAVPRDRLWR